MRRTMATFISIPVSILFALNVLLAFAGVCAHDQGARANSSSNVLHADGDPLPLPPLPWRTPLLPMQPSHAPGVTAPSATA